MNHKIKEINPYSSTHWREQFRHTDLYRRIVKDYDHVIFSWQEATLLKAALHHTVYETDRKVCDLYRILDAVPYYYFHHARIDHADIVVDLGCGLNVFKKTWPNIIGIDSKIDPTPICEDTIVTHFDKNFADEHQDMCDALISINAIHFDKITTIKDRLLWVAQLVRSGGRAFVSFNVETWLMHTSKEDIARLFGAWPTLGPVVDYIYDQVVSTGLDLVVSDWPILRTTEDSSIRDSHNGNVRLVFNC